MSTSMIGFGATHGLSITSRSSNQQLSTQHLINNLAAGVKKKAKRTGLKAATVKGRLLGGRIKTATATRLVTGAETTEPV